MEERPDLRLVEDPEGTAACALCGKPATATSAADGQPLCIGCFAETHWHPSWSRTFDNS